MAYWGCEFTHEVPLTLQVNSQPWCPKLICNTCNGDIMGIGIWGNPEKSEGSKVLATGQGEPWCSELHPWGGGDWHKACTQRLLAKRLFEVRV